MLDALLPTLFLWEQNASECEKHWVDMCNLIIILGGNSGSALGVIPLFKLDDAIIDEKVQ